MHYLRRLRAWVKPEVRDWLDGFAVFFAITLFFCLVQAAHDGIVNRNRSFDSQRWWYPVYKMLSSEASVQNRPPFKHMPLQQRQLT